MHLDLFSAISRKYKAIKVKHATAISILASLEIKKKRGLETKSTDAIKPVFLLYNSFPKIYVNKTVKKPSVILTIRA